MQYASFYGPFDEEWTEDEVHAAIDRNDRDEMLYVPLIVSMSPRVRVWSEQICLMLTTHPEVSVRGNAFEGLGHLARYYRMLNRKLVEPALCIGMSDASEWVRGKVFDSVEEIEWSIGWVFPGREDRRSRPVCPR